MFVIIKWFSRKNENVFIESNYECLGKQKDIVKRYNCFFWMMGWLYLWIMLDWVGLLYEMNEVWVMVCKGMEMVGCVILVLGYGLLYKKCDIVSKICCPGKDG